MDPLHNEIGFDGVSDDVAGGICISSSSLNIRAESWVTDLQQKVYWVYSHPAMATRSLKQLLHIWHWTQQAKSGT